MTLAGKIGDSRWLLAQEVGQGTPKEFVALLVFWLALLFASFSFCTSQRCLGSYPDALRSICVRCDWNDS
jgi:hypothetical protein